MFDPSRQVNRYVPGRVEMYSFKKAAVVSGIGTDRIRDRFWHLLDLRRVFRENKRFVIETEYLPPSDLKFEF